MIKLFTAIIFTNKPKEYTDRKDVEILEIVKSPSFYDKDNSNNFIIFLNKILQSIKTPFFFILHENEHFFTTPPLPKLGGVKGKLITNVNNIMMVDDSASFTRPVYNTEKALSILQCLPIERINVYFILQYFVDLIYGLENNSGYSVFRKHSNRQLSESQLRNLLLKQQLSAKYLMKYKNQVVRDVKFV